MPSLESGSQANINVQRFAEPLRWFDPTQLEQEDPFISLRGRFTELSERLAEADKLFAQHVYNNPNLSDLDVRQHRWAIHYLLYQAEDLALGFLLLRRPDDTASYMNFLDGQIVHLQKVFQEWHGEAEAGEDIPESFNQSMREVAAGHTVEMEEDMFATDAPPEA